MFFLIWEHSAQERAARTIQRAPQSYLIKRQMLSDLFLRLLSDLFLRLLSGLFLRLLKLHIYEISDFLFKDWNYI